VLVSALGAGLAQRGDIKLASLALAPAAIGGGADECGGGILWPHPPLALSIPQLRAH